MPSPFPGMNPYLENPGLWPEVHHWLISAIGQVLAPQLRPRYRVAVEKRIYPSSSEEDSLLVGIPDVKVQRRLTAPEEITGNVAIAEPRTQQPVTVTIPMPEIVRQSYLEIREVPSGEVVTAIEVLSPVNKRSGEGRKAYELKRQKILVSLTHLVEIDLLRGWQPMPILSEVESNYRILVSRSDRRPRADLYAFNLADEIPSFPLPLREGDSEPIVDLQALLGGVYDLIGYDLVIDYSREPVPPLSEAEAAWADALLRERGLRQ